MNSTVNDKINAACGHCGARYLVDPGWVGQQLMCAKCRAIFIVTRPAAPGGPPLGPAAAPPRPAAYAPGSGRPDFGGLNSGGSGSGRPDFGGPGSGGSGGAGGQAAPSHQWVATGMLEVRCQHCGTVIPLSRAFIGSYLACPKCQQRFIVGADGTALPPEPPLHRQLLAMMTDKRFLRVALGAAAIMALLAAGGFIVNHRREAQLIQAMTAVYPAPNYTVAPIKVPQNDRTVHKTADGTRECSSVAYVQVAHEPTGMEFNRVLCKSDGRWEPTFRQRIADQVAADFISNQDQPYGNFDPGALPWTVYNQDAQTVGGLYDVSEVPEEQILARQFGSALDAMTRTGKEPETGGRNYNEDYDYEDYDYEDWNYDYSAELAARQERLYLAHAVMYPEQADELFQSGKISQMP